MYNLDIFVRMVAMVPNTVDFNALLSRSIARLLICSMPDIPLDNEPEYWNKIINPFYYFTHWIASKNLFSKGSNAE